jgi:hypothetical protein
MELESGHLATHATLFQNLWQLVHNFKVNISVHDEDMVGGVREQDQSLISEFSWVGYRGKEVISHSNSPLMTLPNLRSNSDSTLSDLSSTWRALTSAGHHGSGWRGMQLKERDGDAQHSPSNSMTKPINLQKSL